MSDPADGTGTAEMPMIYPRWEYKTHEVGHGHLQRWLDETAAAGWQLHSLLPEWSNASLTDRRVQTWRVVMHRHVYGAGSR